MLTRLNLFSPIPTNKISLNKNNIREYFGCNSDIAKSLANQNIKNIENNEILIEALRVYNEHLNKYTTALYYNLKTLDFMIVEDIKCDGFYKLNHKTNLCVLKNKALITAYHELIHIASSYYNKNNNNLYSGFVYSPNFGITMGEGITEGYVELLCSRHLNNDCLTYDYNTEDNSCITSYLYANILAHQLEILIGEEEIKDMFFDCGFFSLSNFISKYTDQKTAYKFLKYCDISALSDFNKDLILNSYIFKAQNILYYICRNYMPQKQMSLQKYLVYNITNPTCVALQEEIQKYYVKKLEV